MSAVAVLLLVPNVVLLPPDAPAALAPVAETCAQAVSASPELHVTRLAPSPAPGSTVADRVRPDLEGAAQAYRELRFREAKDQAERVVRVLEAEASGPGDFEALLQARLRLALVHLGQRHTAPARMILEAAVRTSPRAEVTDTNWPPNLVEAWEQAREAVAREPGVAYAADVQTSIAGVPARVWVDGQPVEGGTTNLTAGDHVVVATAPGHETRRLVVHLPGATSPIVLPASTVVPPGALVIATTLEGEGARVRVVVTRSGGGEASRDTDVAGAPAAALEMIETLAGVPRRVAAAAGSGTGTGPSTGSGTGNSTHTGTGTGTGTDETRSGGSILGRWWFWTIAGGVVVVGFLAAVAVSRRDPGTDVHVGVAP